MDAASLAAMVAAVLTPLSPYLVKAGEGLASSVGKELGAKATNLIGTLFNRSEKVGNEVQLRESMTRLGTDNDAQQTLKSFIIQQAREDPNFADHLDAQLNDIRIVILECLQTRFLTQNLRELYFRLGIGWDELAGAGSSNREKAIALIEEMWVSQKIPKLVTAMWHVRPDLRC